MHLKTVSSDKERENSIAAKENITVSLQGMVRNNRVGLEERSQATDFRSNGTLRKFQKFLRSLRLYAVVFEQILKVPKCREHEIVVTRDIPDFACVDHFVL
jgi:hypothetical protein